MRDYPVFARAISQLFGWIYVICWSASFYPQPLLNWRRRSTIGMAIDFSVLNVIGFSSYTCSTAAFLFSPQIRDEYAQRHPRSPEPTVRFNDFIFALHGLVMCLLVYSQFWPAIWGFKVGSEQRASPAALGIVWGSLAALAITASTVLTLGRAGGNDASTWAWLELVYVLSYIKLFVTVIKYVPQVWVNYQRQSTLGWSINQILLDLAGGILSIAQLVLDSALLDDWSGVTGNPVKFGLGNVSMLFAVIFVVQHYCLYGPCERTPRSVEQNGNSEPDEHTPLLRAS